MNNNKIKLKNNNDNKNKDINDKNKDTNDKNQNKLIKSIDGYNCIGPCYPANTIYYNPISLTPIKSTFPTCPIKKTISSQDSGEKKIIYAKECKKSDITDEYKYFDIFDDSVQIANSSDNFLKQIYEINNIQEVIYFLNNSIDVLPIYTQKRILKAIHEVYYKYIEFPKLFFADKILKILNEVYKINLKITSNELIKDLDIINSNSYEIYKFFVKKYLK